MTFLKNLWTQIRGHSVAWTIVLVAILSFAALRQPSWQSVGGGALIAGLATWFSMSLRNGFTFGKINYLLLGALGSCLLSAALIALILPLSSTVTVALWNELPVVVVVALTLLRITWVLHHHSAPATAAATAGDGKDAPKPTPVKGRTGKVVRTLVVGTVIGGWFFAVNHVPVLYQSELARSFNPELIQTMDGTKNDRQLARDTAQAALTGGGLDSNTATAVPHLVPTPDCPVWQAPRYTRDPVGRFFGSIEDVVQVKACTTKSELLEHKDAAAFIYGDKSWVVQGVLAARHPFSTKGETVFTRRPSDGAWVMLISQVSTAPTWLGAMVPYMTGADEVDGSGHFRFLTVEEIAQTYSGLPLYPFDLMRQYATAEGKFTGGWQDVLWYGKHNNVIAEDRTDDPNANRAPYNMHTVHFGQQAMMALGPDGSDLTSAWLYWDPATGAARKYVPTRKLWSPKVAIAESRKADPSMDRSHMRTVESRPVVIDLPNGDFKLYYLVAVISDDPNSPNTHSFVEAIVVDADNKGAVKILDGDFDSWEQRVRGGPAK